MTQIGVSHILSAISSSTLKYGLKNIDVSWLKLKKDILEKLMRDNSLTNITLR